MVFFCKRGKSPLDNLRFPSLTVFQRTWFEDEVLRRLDSVVTLCEVSELAIAPRMLVCAGKALSRTNLELLLCCVSVCKGSRARDANARSRDAKRGWLRARQAGNVPGSPCGFVTMRRVCQETSRIMQASKHSQASVDVRRPAGLGVVGCRHGSVVALQFAERALVWISPQRAAFVARGSKVGLVRPLPAGCCQARRSSRHHATPVTPNSSSSVFGLSITCF